MAAKRDLVEAQSFSRRRLLTAFVSGAPGGQELEPTKPMRGVVAGIMLSVLVVIGSLAWGALRSDPKDWSNNRLVVVSGEGTRYLALGGELFPVVNTTSARLGVPAGQFEVVQLARRVIDDAPLRETVGIVGAPDSPPAAASLVTTGWTSCVAPDGLATSLGTGPGSPATGTATGTATQGSAAPSDDRAVVATSAGRTFVVTHGARHLVPDDEVSGVLRAIGLDTVAPVEVPAAWLHLFPEGSDLAPLEVAGAGRPAPADSPLRDLDVGTVVRVSGTGTADRWYVVDRRGQLAVLSEFATALYRAPAGAQEVTRSLADLQDAQTATTAVAPEDWPATPVEALEPGAAPCAVLTTGDDEHVALVAAPQPPAAGVHVVPGGGALVVGRAAAAGPGVHALVDETGRRFALPTADQGDDDVLVRLGYSADLVTPVPAAWLDLFAPGPDLTTDAALTPVVP